MKKVNFNQSKFSRFLSGKGFYVALCASIVTVGAAGFAAYHQTASKLENQLNGAQNPPVTTSAPKEWGYEDFDDVGVPKTDVPKTEVTTAPEEPVIARQETIAKTESIAPQPKIMPLNGELINPFSNGELVKSKTLGSWKTHDGIDIRGTLGDQVKSMTSGKVIDIREDPMWGACVIIDHGEGLEGYYYNLNKVIPVKVDQSVSAGTVIGAIGDTAEAELAEPSHLHFALKKDGKWIDPMTVIQTN